MNAVKAKIASREERFTQIIIEAIEKGVDVWQRGWKFESALCPHNPSTGTFYKGINALNLAFTSMFNGWENNEFLTFNQVKALEGSVMKGSKGNVVDFFFEFKKLNEEQLANLSEKTRQSYYDEFNKLSNYQKNKLNEEGEIFILRSFCVFNVAQCENINTQKLNDLRQKNNIPSIEEFKQRQFTENPFIEAILHNANIPIKFVSNATPCYIPTLDEIRLPLKEQFKSVGDYYCTALHELDRDLSGKFGTPSYAKEELRAETYSLIQAFDLGIDYHLEKHASYLEAWSKCLKDKDFAEEIKLAVKDAMKINEFVKKEWYPKDMSLNLQKIITQQEDKTQNLTPTIKPKSQESKGASIANNSYLMSR